ncbi:PD-(D/E)XK nuclease family protein [Aliikangiella sp. IMCC44653]
MRLAILKESIRSSRLTRVLLHLVLASVSPLAQNSALICLSNLVVLYTMPITINTTKIQSQDSDGCLFLAPNARTKQALIAGFVANAAEGEVRVAQSVYSFSEWLDLLWEELSFQVLLPVIIGNLELKSWLKQKIEADTQWQLTNELGVAEKMLDAYKVLSQWGISLNSLGKVLSASEETCIITQDLLDLSLFNDANLEPNYLNEQGEKLAESLSFFAQQPSAPCTLDSVSKEVECFINFGLALESFLMERNLIASFKKLWWLIENQRKLITLLPEKIVLVGFNQLTPAEQSFIQLCIKSGSQVSEFQPQVKADFIKRTQHTELKSELEFAAKLTKQITLESPDKNIAVVVHQLANYTDQVHDIFSQVFHPEEDKPWVELERMRYNVSAGESFQALPLIYIATKILGFDYKGLNLESLYLIKTTPFIDWGQHTAEIRAFLNQLGNLSYPQYSYDFILQAIKTHAKAKELELLKQRIELLLNASNTPRPMQAWVDSWSHRLQYWGWGVKEKLNQAELKQLKEFEALMLGTKNLTRVYDKPRHSQAKEFLFQAIKQASFQMPSDRTNIHILGVLEAAGLEFDATIIVGFNQSNWPQKAKLNPFIPTLVQQTFKMPNSSAEKEYEYAKDISSSLLNSASSIWITESFNEAGETNSSSFFEKISLCLPSEFVADSAEPIFTPDYQWITDEKIDLQESSIKGGTYLLSNYAACPFKSLSSFLFDLSIPEDNKPGIQAKIKGSWLHTAMEFFWNKVKDKKTLLAMEQSQIDESIRRALLDAKNVYLKQLYANASEPVIDIEFNKLFQQIRELLIIETQKPDFKVATEIEQTLNLNGIDLKFRVDRIDTLADGSIEIIDYKTGSTDIKKWLGERPQEAQMPAYILANQQSKVAGLYYAKVKTGEIAQSGFSFSPQLNENDLQSPFKETVSCIELSAENKLDKTKSFLKNTNGYNFNLNVLAQWRHDLSNLAENIKSGYMPVSPQSTSENCRFCELSDFCRIQEGQPEKLACSTEETADE